MDDKIKEVMGLVDFYAEMYKEFPDWGDHSQRDVNSAHQAIESKLRELVEGEKAEVERMRGALKGLVELGISGGSVLFTAEYDRARDALVRMPS